MTPDAIAQRYLDLLARTLTGTLYEEEPNHDTANQGEFVVAFTLHYLRGSAVSMQPKVRLDNIRDCVKQVLADNVAGDFMETGVWRGGGCIYARAALDVYGGGERTVWVCDSFEGMPKPDAEKHPGEAKFFDSPMMQDMYNRLEATLPDVTRNFEAFQLLSDKVKFVKGWFKDTMPTVPVQQLAILRLDGDYYDSTMDVLKHMYGKVSPGGYVIVDDYGETGWANCRGATDDFRRDQNISAPLIKVDSKCWYWRKPF
ncbi:MAG TPA: TylF/MycF/NovP-related O-methyltransferase [Nevskiaceae bacterium]|nr:TylF/MycF/NovP-related O-methyltransferase [Nevskiaceae bacterium]